MVPNSQPRWPVLAQLWWIIEQQRRRRGAAPVVIPPAPPGLVALDPQADGVHFTMPSLPAGATALTLYKSTVDSPDLEDWLVVATGLAGGATGIDATGFDEDGPEGWGGQGCFYKVQAETSLLVSASSSTTTTLAPDAPDVVTLDPQPDGVHWLAPALPARALSMTIQKKTDDFPTWRNLVVGVPSGSNGIDAFGPYDGEWLSAEGYASSNFYYRTVSSNIYGSTNGPGDLAVTVPLPTDPSYPPSVTATGEAPPESTEYWMEVTMPETLPANASCFRLFASGSPGEPGDDRGLWPASAVVNTNGADFGSGNPCGTTLSVGCKGHNVYGDSASMNYDDGYSAPACP